MIRVLALVAILTAIAVLIFVVRSKLLGSREERRSIPRQPTPATGLLMFLLTVPVLVAAVIAMARGLLVPMIGNAVGYALLVCGAWLLWRGLVAEAAYSHRLVAKTPWPLKAIGGGLIGLGTGLTAWLGVGHHPGIAFAFGLVALLGCRLFYGGDPGEAKRVTAASGLDTTDQVLAALAQAERSIAAVEQSSRDVRQPELNQRLRRVAALAREILTLLEEDPRDLRRARKFLNVYLDGVQRVVEGYARTHQRAASPELDANFRRVLTSIEEVFQEQRQKLLESDIMDLDVQIEVLTSQLKREGLL
ncbi:5-bromo-4-chloroindolyl phosphate hydrolysis family protein [Thiocapsa roseopersicina]|uniref:5-bromo-4-chloroindolyl phosphate hydrolysis protein n=1 Tax=Thiocapsa roseopersicina TaxID=1058 RepID=A0A1H2SRR3_THIRO|nr:5-bromo-4-chloroindolyl phosphate hydrolysis family protein [Thiocapsa roseopersicina]SDW34217.1 5-bromo-4-chloroindolyl phosphate hydrolysis protein [Thiocapsa roseopersicina]